MSWLKIDDHFAENRKVAKLSDRAFRLHLIALCYCARNLTDGYLDKKATNVVCAILDRPSPRRYIKELVEQRLWRDWEEGHGYQLNDYLEYNPDAETVRARAEERKAAGKRGAEARWGGKKDGGSDSSSYADSDGSRAYAPSRPVPFEKPKSFSGKCPECGTGGGLHVADCRLAA